MRYTVSDRGSIKKYLEIVREHEDGFEVEITQIGENYTKSTKDYVSRSLFDACIRTGYISGAAGK